MGKKNWPSDTHKPASFEDLVEPIVKAIKKTHRVTKKKLDGPIPWDGFPDVGPTGRACTYTKMKDILSPDTLRYHEERGRDLLNVLVSAAVSFGVEQGRRIQRERMKEHACLIKHLGFEEWLKRFEE